MQFDLDEDRALLKSSTRELLDKESALSDARRVMEEEPEGFSRAFHGQLGQLGYLGLAVPEAEGGSGAGPLGLVAVLHEMGRVALPGPYLDLVCAGEALRRAENEEAARWLAALVAGEKLVLPAERESAEGVVPLPPRTRFARGRVKGRKSFVPYGASADALLVTCVEGLALVPRPEAGWSSRPLETLDHAQRFVEMELDAPGVLVAEEPRSDAVLAAASRLGCLGAAALLLGLAERCLELSVGYLTERKAFGVPIGSLQALQHRAADMLLRVESTRSAVYRAAWSEEHDPDRAPYLVAVAKVYAGESARLVCGETIQLFGGVGFTWEYDPHIYYKRVKTLEQRYGRTRDALEIALAHSGL